MGIIWEVINMVRRKTNDEFVEELHLKQGNKYQLLSPYVTAKTKINVICNDCKNECWMNPHDLLLGMCKTCGYKRVSECRSKTEEEFSKEVSDTKEYILVGKYSNSKEKCLIKHLTCGQEFLMTPAKFSCGQRCPKCMRPKYGRTGDELKTEIENIDSEYEVLGTPSRIDEKVLLKHKKCGYKYLVTPHKFINGGRRCPMCADNIKLNNEEFIERLKSVHGEEYELLSNYNGNRDYVVIKHTTCGHIWKVRPYNILQGKGCPACRESKGEKEIANFLEKNSYLFVRQYKFKDCRLKNPLPFDFAVFKNAKIFLIEFQGEQHYKARPFFGGENAFELQQKRDCIKKRYCEINNFKLIAICYKDIEKIPIILKGFL